MNLSLAPSGVGKMKLSSTTSLRLSRVENVTLRKEPDASGSSGWLHVVGDGNSTDGAQYQFDIPTSFLRTGGKDKAISMAFSHDSEHFMFDSWGMVCSTQ